MVNSFIARKDLDSEMTVVRNEFERGENNPASILSERVASTAYLWHNYGKSTIGSKVDLEKVPVDRLSQFYKKYYQPDNAVLVITGRLDEAKTLQMVADSMGSLKFTSTRPSGSARTCETAPSSSVEAAFTLPSGRTGGSDPPWDGACAAAVAATARASRPSSS